MEENKINHQMEINENYYYPLQTLSLEDTLKNINEERVKFYDYLSSANKVNKFTLFGFLAVLLIFLVSLLLNKENVNELFPPLMLVFVVFLIVSYFLVKNTKKRKNIAFDGYKKEYFLNIDSYCYYQTGISNLAFSYNSIVEKEAIEKIGCYENIIKTVTRDVVVGKMFGTAFTSYDLLLKSGKNISDESDHQVLFSGKMFYFDLPIKQEGKMFIYLKGCGDSHPTELEGLDKISIKGLKDDYLVFSSIKANNVISKKAIEVLNQIQIDQVIEDVIISISNQGIFFGISLTKEYMTIPFENEVKEDYLKHYKNDIENIKTFISVLMSNKNYQ